MTSNQNLVNFKVVDLVEIYNFYIDYFFIQDHFKVSKICGFEMSHSTHHCRLLTITGSDLSSITASSC